MPTSGPKSILKVAASAAVQMETAGEMAPETNAPDQADLSIVELYKAARDENELLEFKNYELQFKIQELELNQRRILSAICSSVTIDQPVALTHADVGHRQAPPPTKCLPADQAPPSPPPARREEEEQSDGQLSCGPLASARSELSLDKSGAAAGAVMQQSGDQPTDRVTSEQPAPGRASDNKPAVEARESSAHANESDALLSHSCEGALSLEDDDDDGDGDGAPTKVDHRFGHEKANTNNEHHLAAHDKYEERRARKTNRPAREQVAEKHDAGRLLIECSAGQRDGGHSGRARIALPVQSGRPSDRKPAAGQQPRVVATKSGRTDAGPTPACNPLRARSKSSLEQKRRPVAQVAGGSASLRRAISSRRVSTATAESAPIGRAGSGGQQQSGSFVTHIPTLIVGSHAATGESSMMRRIMRSRRPVSNEVERERLAASAHKSKSLGNLAPNRRPTSSQSVDHVTRAACVPVGSISKSDEPVELAECNECARNRRALAELELERAQLREQLIELEELENDSRLASQKLAQQLQTAEEKLERSRGELTHACESESKLRFQNKRLHFELRQRHDSLSQLQFQVNELRARVRALSRHQANKEDVGYPSEPLNSGQQEVCAWPETRADDSDSACEELEKRLQTEPPKPASAYDSAYSKSSSSSSGADSSTNSEADASEGQPSGAPPDEQASSLPGWASEQQVLRKRIATARILRGIQVQPTTMSTAEQLDAGEPPAAVDNQQVPTDQLEGRREQPILSAQSSDRSIGQCATDCAAPDKQPGQEVGREKQSPTNQISTAAAGARSPIELALEGVDGLERAIKVAIVPANPDEAAVHEGQPANEGAADENNNERLAPASGELTSERLLAELKHEVSNLRLRLVQATTLNDNLVRELRTQAASSAGLMGARSRPSSQVAPATAPSRVQVGAGRTLDGRRSSVIYVNGLSASVTHHHHHYDQEQQQQKLRQTMAAVCASCQRSCPDDRYSARELLDWLRFLLDKLHLHHGRTFELVSECQKFALNALLAGQTHRAHLFHHQRVVAAGEQALRRAEQQQQQQQQLQQQWQHVASGRVLIDNSQATMAPVCPVRPPPRRRASSGTVGGGNRPLDQSEMDAMVAPREQQQTAGVSALQVARRTLFSLVPIYYSSNSKQPQVESSASSESGVPPPANLLASATERPANKTGVPAECIYATVNKAPARPAGVSVLEINNNKRLNQGKAVSQQQEAASPGGGPFARTLASLSEDMERFRVHSNGQLLDLLMRQNWCESLVSERIKSIELALGGGASQQPAVGSIECGLPKVANNGPGQ